MMENFDEFAELPPDEPSFFHKFFVVIVAIVLVVLMVSLSFVNQLSGVIPSRTVDSDVLRFQNATIIFEGDSLRELQSHYLDNQEREIKACLFGKKSDETYIVERVDFPKIERANVAHVLAEVCPSDVLIDLHSHPVNSCLASDQDVSVFEYLKSRNPDVKMMIMCSKDRFALA